MIAEKSWLWMALGKLAVKTLVDAVARDGNTLRPVVARQVRGVVTREVAHELPALELADGGPAQDVEHLSPAQVVDILRCIARTHIATCQ